MKNTLGYLLLLVCLSLSNVYAKTVVISDLDDTIKITEGVRPVRTIINGLFTTRVFAGMPELYQHMRNYVDETVVLTASPKILRGRVKKLLSKHNVPYENLIMRSLRHDKDKFKYKFDNIEAYIQDNDEDDFILLGDDSGEDHEVYHAIAKKYPTRVTAIYIRPIKGKELAEEIIPYYTAFDIALNEYNEGRLTYHQLKDIALIIDWTEKPRKNLIPKKFKCPEDASITAGIEELIKMVSDKVKAACKSPKKA